MITSFQVESLRGRIPCYFTGYGLGPSSTFSHCCYGIGDTESEALDDCLEQLRGNRADPETEARIKAAYGSPTIRKPRPMPWALTKIGTKTGRGHIFTSASSGMRANKGLAYAQEQDTSTAAMASRTPRPKTASCFQETRRRVGASNAIKQSASALCRHVASNPARQRYDMARITHGHVSECEGSNCELFRGETIITDCADVCNVFAILAGQPRYLIGWSAGVLRAEYVITARQNRCARFF